MGRLGTGQFCALLSNLSDCRFAGITLGGSFPGCCDHDPPCLTVGGYDQRAEASRANLAIVAAGLSNQEIAERLVMTVGTVKWYLHHLYCKLAVRGRTSAVACGRELGLLRSTA
jgi:DNA-binding CsgD family transcriptional regulator